VEQACRLTVREVRAGSPLVAVHPARRSARQQNLIEGLTVPLNETSVGYGDGDSGKGWLGCLVAVALATGHAFPHIRPTQRGLRVAYLDWESTQEDFEARLDAIARGAGLTLPPGLVYYRSLSRPLAAEAGALRADFARLGVQATIIDSLIPASGEEPEGAAAAIGALNALRSFIGVTRFALSHVSKTSAEQLRGPLRPFGSVFMRNLVRSAWEIRRDEEAGPDELLLAAYHRKHNMGPKSPALSLSLHFAPDGALTVAHADLAAAPTLLARASVSVQLEAALRAGATTSAALAARLKISKATVDRTLGRLAIKRTVIKLSTTKPFTWGLAAR
jgi:AAA domain